MLNILLVTEPSGWQSWVWMDYRLAVLLTVICPLILLIWAFVQKIEAVQRLLVIYWRVASLLAITVYLMIGALPIGFLSAFLSRLLIPASLWFWVDLNEEIDDLQFSPVKLAFTSWRWAVSVYNGIGALVFLPALKCAFSGSEDLLSDSGCRIWLDPPWAYKELFHSGWTAGFLGFLGLAGLVIYLLYFGYFLLVRLGKQGRSATGQ
ncbi:MAG: DUF3177 family protein [Microcoleaceae cyanobacterium]